MGLKNYTTKIDANKTVMQIENMLANFGATDIWKQYDHGVVISLNFATDTEFGKMPFKLPLKIKEIRQTLITQRQKGNINLPQRLLQDDKHSLNVGWRIIKDWIDSQLSLIELEQVKIEQIFLPYAYDMATDKTFYEVLKERKFAGMLMENNAT